MADNYPPRDPRSGGSGGYFGAGNRGNPGTGRPAGGRPGGGRPGGRPGGFGDSRGGRGPGGPGGCGPDRGRPERDQFDSREPRQPRLPKPDIIYKDDSILIINKPAGIPVRGSQTPTLVEMVDALTGARRRQMRVAHELDPQASGAVLFVAMRDSQDSPRDQTHPETSYLALVQGEFSDEAATTGESVSSPVSRSSGLGATPSSHIRVLDSGNGVSLVQVRARPDLPEQVREHLALIGHPVVGDHKHGATRDDLHRVGLHAQQIRLTHPEDEKTQRYKVQAPAAFWVAMGKEPPPDALINEAEEDAPSHAKKGWDHVAGWYDSLIADRGSDHHQRVIMPGVMRMLDVKSGDRVLDVACGQGIMSEYIVHHADVESVLGVDVSPALVDAASQRATDRTSYRVWDACELATLDAGPFDAAVCVMALMNIENPDAVFTGVLEKLKPGAQFLCVISHPSFRIMGGSAWGWTMDERSGQQVQFRRVDQYLSEQSSPIVMNPGEAAQGKPPVTTVTHHRPLSSYIASAIRGGLVVDGIEEWASERESEPGPRAAAENRARREIPLFMAISFRKPAADPKNGSEAIPGVSA